ncbi:hypothetical protein [Dactylosporangium salmoneum]|uniref:hypothetical protein n=1 Tax=Dactylosporangium salmoneum TaxID=53361 RepID=UPI0031E112C0
MSPAPITIPGPLLMDRAPDDVIAVFDNYYWKDVEDEYPLAEWMAHGPGPRHGRRPRRARSRSTGEDLPLSVIPLAARNNRESRALIAAGKIEPPWRHIRWLVEDGWGDPPCEVLGPRPFDGSVPDPAATDLLTKHVLACAQIPEFEASAPAVVRRLAGERRWEDFETVVRMATAADLADVAPVLCDVLRSDTRPPRLDHIVDALARLMHDEAADLLESLVAQFVYAFDDPPAARHCLRAMARTGPHCRVRLILMSWDPDSWPPPLPEWAVEAMEAVGEHVPPRP